MPFLMSAEKEVTVCGRVLDTRRDILNIGSPKPINTRGPKSIDCPFYGDCLTHAATMKWKTWTCEDCPNLWLDLAYRKLKSIAPYYPLLAEIYPEFKRKYEAVMKLMPFANVK